MFQKEHGSLRMSAVVKIVLVALGLTGVLALVQNNQGQNNNNQGGGVHGAPGPLAGAGLPVLLIGGGIYWIVRRKKRAS
jgi:LPXTG-motif cell wall-anchored protein